MGWILKGSTERDEKQRKASRAENEERQQKAAVPTFLPETEAVGPTTR